MYVYVCALKLFFDPSMLALPIIVKEFTKHWIVHPQIGNMSYHVLPNH